MIISQNVSSEAQVKNYFYFVENLCSVLKIFKFLYFLPSHDLPNLWRHVSISTWDGAFLNISFELQLIKSPKLVSNINKGSNFQESFWTILRTGAKFQVLLNLATCSNYLITNYVKIALFH